MQCIINLQHENRGWSPKILKHLLNHRKIEILYNIPKVCRNLYQFLSAIEPGHMIATAVFRGKTRARVISPPRSVIFLQRPQGIYSPGPSSPLWKRPRLSYGLGWMLAKIDTDFTKLLEYYTKSIFLRCLSRNYHKFKKCFKFSGIRPRLSSYKLIIHCRILFVLWIKQRLIKFIV